MAMFWNGVRIGMAIIRPHLLQIRGGGHHQARPGWDAAAAGTAAPCTAGRLGATPAALAAATTTSACAFRGRLSNNLSFYNITICKKDKQEPENEGHLPFQ